uniref:Uncharacterized protein n=1 Tax=Lotharella globosa TaxID=91324 RepID=A0A6V3NPR3_9EUKA
MSSSPTARAITILFLVCCCVCDVCLSHEGIRGTSIYRAPDRGRKGFSFDFFLCVLHRRVSHVISRGGLCLRYVSVSNRLKKRCIVNHGGYQAFEAISVNRSVQFKSKRHPHHCTDTHTTHSHSYVYSLTHSRTHAHVQTPARTHARTHTTHPDMGTNHIQHKQLRDTNNINDTKQTPRPHSRNKTFTKVVLFSNPPSHYQPKLIMQLVFEYWGLDAKLVVSRDEDDQEIWKPRCATADEKVKATTWKEAIRLVKEEEDWTCVHIYTHLQTPTP